MGSAQSISWLCSQKTATGTIAPSTHISGASREMGGNRIKTWRSHRRKKIPVYRRVLLCGADSSCRPRGALGIIFVDGRHLFDFALTDFTVSGELCPMGGHIILADMWLPSIQRVVAFIRENREDFTEVETPVGNIAVFRRTGADDREFKHFMEL